jgi:hypothetical protein
VRFSTQISRFERQRKKHMNTKANDLRFTTTRPASLGFARARFAGLALALLVVACGAEIGDGSADPMSDSASQATPRATEAEAALEDVAAAEQTLAETSCGHSICEVGPRVSATCDSCVASICDVDPFCCTDRWDSLCVAEVGSVCGRGPIAVTADTLVSSIKVRMRTGGDDLRGGSQAYGSFQLAGGASLAEVSLNSGAGFGNGSVATASIPISPARRLGSLSGFTLKWDGAPRNLFDTYDNWNLDELRFFVQPAGRCPRFLGPALSPGRMTGSRTLFSAAVTFP